MKTSKASLALTGAEQRRAERVDLLASLGPDGLDELLQMLDDPSWTVRRNVVASLGSLGDPAVVPLCILLRTRRDNEARIAAIVDALVASIGRAEGALVELTEDSNPAVVADVAQILGRRRHPGSLPALSALTMHADDNVSVMAIEGLGRIGGRSAVESLVRIIEGGNFFRTFPAIDVLGRSGDPRAVEPLASLLSNPLYVMEAARALGRTGDKRAIGPLAMLLLQPSEAHVRIAALALADLHARLQAEYDLSSTFEETLRRAVPAARAVRRLTQALPGADTEEQIASCFVLGRLGNQDAIPTLTGLLDDMSPVAEAAGWAMEHLGVESENKLFEALREGDSARRMVLLPLVNRSNALDHVRECLTDPDPGVRVLACETLGRLGQQRAAPSVFRLLSDSDPRVVHAATGAIQALGGEETETLALEATRSGSPNVQRAAIRILSYFGSSAALPALLDALREGSPRIREQALQGLALVEDPRALETLLGTMRHSNERLRAQAARALGQCASDDLRIASYLIRALEDPDPWVRYYATQSLGKRECEAAADAIAQRLQDEAGQVRVAAVEALSHLPGTKGLSALRTAAASSDPDVERAALVGLGIRRDASSLPTLLVAARSKDSATRLVALSAISGFLRPEVLEALRQAASDEDENVRNTAIGFLASHSGVEATTVLVELLRAAPRADRLLAALSTSTAGRVVGLTAALDTSDDELALQLAATLARLRRREANEALVYLLSRPNVAARKAAATALSALSTKEALDALRRAAYEDPDPEVRRICSLVAGP